jgi:hypothetical protein
MRHPARLAAIVALLLLLGPPVAAAHDAVARPHHRSSRPVPRPRHAIPCCFGAVSAPPTPAVVVVPPPPIYVIVPSPPSLAPVPTPRPEPTPEITLATGRWARHGNGVDYPYVWVWEGPAPER